MTASKRTCKLVAIDRRKLSLSLNCLEGGRLHPVLRWTSIVQATCCCHEVRLFRIDSAKVAMMTKEKNPWKRLLAKHRDTHTTFQLSLRGVFLSGITANFLTTRTTSSPIEHAYPLNNFNAFVGIALHFALTKLSHTEVTKWLRRTGSHRCSFGVSRSVGLIVGGCWEPLRCLPVCSSATRRKPKTFTVASNCVTVCGAAALSWFDARTNSFRRAPVLGHCQRETSMISFQCSQRRHQYSRYVHLPQWLRLLVQKGTKLVATKAQKHWLLDHGI